MKKFMHRLTRSEPAPLPPTAVSRPAPPIVPPPMRSAIPEDRVYEKIRQTLEDSIKYKIPFMSPLRERVATLLKIIHHLYTLYISAKSSRSMEQISLSTRFILSRQSSFINDCELLLCQQELLFQGYSRRSPKIDEIEVNPLNIYYSALVDVHRIYFSFMYDKILSTEELLSLSKTVLIQEEQAFYNILLKLLDDLFPQHLPFIPAAGEEQAYLDTKNLQRQVATSRFLTLKNSLPSAVQLDEQKCKWGMLLTATDYLCNYCQHSRDITTLPKMFALLISHQAALNCSPQDFSLFDNIPASGSKFYNAYMSIYSIYAVCQDKLSRGEFNRFVYPTKADNLSAVDQEYGSILKQLELNLYYITTPNILLVPDFYEDAIKLEESLRFSPEKALHFKCLVIAFIYGDDKSFIAIFQAWYNRYFAAQNYIQFPVDRQTLYRDLLNHNFPNGLASCYNARDFIEETKGRLKDMCYLQRLLVGSYCLNIQLKGALKEIKEVKGEEDLYKLQFDVYNYYVSKLYHRSYKENFQERLHTGQIRDPERGDSANIMLAPFSVDKYRIGLRLELTHFFALFPSQ